MTDAESFGIPARLGRLVWIDPASRHVREVDNGSCVAEAIVGQLVDADGRDAVHIGRRRFALCEDPRIIGGRLAGGSEGRGIYLIDVTAEPPQQD